MPKYVWDRSQNVQLAVPLLMKRSQCLYLNTEWLSRSDILLKSTSVSYGISEKVIAHWHALCAEVSQFDPRHLQRKGSWATGLRKTPAMDNCT